MSDAQPSPPSEDPLARLVAQRHEFLGFLERRLGSRALAEDLLQKIIEIKKKA